MNITSFSASVTSIYNSTTVIVESWFIPLDILLIVSLTLTIILAIIFLFVMIEDKTCHTVPMLLTGNICLTGFASATIFLGKTIFTLNNDLQRIQYENIFSYGIGYSIYGSGALHNYSYVLVAIYRYLTIVYPHKLVWQSVRIQMLLIGLSWLLAWVVPIPIAVTGPLIYNVDNQICVAPLGFSFSMVYAPIPIYIIPVHLVIFIYWKLVRYVRDMNQRVTPANTLSRAQKSLKMVRQIVILVKILFISGFPMTLFVFLSFANRAPIYHFRIGFMFVEISMLFVLIVLFQFTDPLKTSIKKKLFDQQNTVAIAII